jgi:SAM-dependent methyltransferase
MDNRHIALTNLDLADKVGLEIGPLNRPLVRKGEAQVYYADHLSTEGLREKYRHDPAVDIAQIVEADFDLSQTTFRDAIALITPLDFVVASHVIEHVPDLVGWLSDIHAALRVGGVLALVIPDKRFTFDIHRRETPLWEVEAAHAEKRTRPSLGIALDHFLNVVNVDAGELWRDYSIGRDAHRAMPPTVTQKVYEQWHDGRYIDAHCWVFTPWSFLRIIGWIVRKYGLYYGLRWAEPTPHNQLEFYVQLEKQTHTSAVTDWEEAANILQARAAVPG